MAKDYLWSALAQTSDAKGVTSALCAGYVRGAASEDEVRGMAFAASLRKKPGMSITDIIVLLIPDKEEAA